MGRTKVRIIPAIDESLKLELEEKGYSIEADFDSVLLSSEQANTLVRINLEDFIIKITEYKAPHKPQFIWFEELALINKLVCYLGKMYE